LLVTPSEGLRVTKGQARIGDCPSEEFGINPRQGQRIHVHDLRPAGEKLLLQ